MRLEKGYYEFHGKSPKKETSFDFHVPKGLVILGKAVAVEYYTDKKHGGGDGRHAIYRHEFETPCVVCMDERQTGQLYILGKKLKVTEAGIEN